MVVRQHAAALRRGVERNAGLLDERLQLRPSLRPDDAAAGDDDRLRAPGEARRPAHRPAWARRAGARSAAAGRESSSRPALRRFWRRECRRENRDRPARACRSSPSGRRCSPARGMRLRLKTRSAHLVHGFMIATWSISWNTWRPNWPIGLEPPIATTGAQSISALATPVMRLVDAGAARRHAHARLLQQPTIGLAHERGRLLVANVDQADALLDAGGLGEQHRPAHDEEQMSVPSFFSDFARISEPVSSRHRMFPSIACRCSDRRCLCFSAATSLLAEAEPIAQHVTVCSPSSGAARAAAGAAEAHRPGGHLEGAAAGARIVCMMPRRSKLGSSCSSLVSSTAPAGMPASPRIAHRLVLVVLARPVSDHGVDLRLVLGARRGGVEARIADQILASDHLQQARQCSGLARLV